MIQFPLDLIPNHITIDKLPIAPLATLTPGVALFTSTIGLTDTPCGGQITLHFTNQATKTKTVKGMNIFTGQCNSAERGWVDAWRFFSTTLKSGRLKFEIPATSLVWRRVEYYPDWIDLSHGGQPSLWRMASITNDNAVGDIRQITKFKILLRHEIRTPVWI